MRPNLIALPGACGSPGGVCAFEPAYALANAGIAQGDHAAMTGNNQLGGKFCQRGQYEQALVQARVGQPAARIIADVFAEQQQIEIQGARRVGHAALPAEVRFDGEKLLQQAHCRFILGSVRLDFQAHHGIDEIRLIAQPDRCSQIQSGGAVPADTNQLAQRSERGADGTRRFAEIGTERDVGGD